MPRQKLFNAHVRATPRGRAPETDPLPAPVLGALEAGIAADIPRADPALSVGGPAQDRPAPVVRVGQGDSAMDWTGGTEMHRACASAPLTLMEAVLAIVEHAERQGRLRYPGESGLWQPPYDQLRRWLAMPDGAREVDSEESGETMDQLFRLAELPAAPAKDTPHAL